MVETPPPRFPAESVAHWARETPGKVALRSVERNLTYGELDARADAVASGLRAHGLGPGDAVAYLGTNAPEFFETWFGANRVGAALAPLNFRSAPPEIAQFIEDARPTLIVANEQFRPVLEKVRAITSASFDVLYFSPGDASSEFETWIAAQPPLGERHALRGDEIALLSYTSGTTGVPKGVQWPHTAFESALRWNVAEPSMGWTADDVALMVMPNFHLAGSWVSTPALSFGGTISILPALDPTAVLKAIREWGVTAVCLVPTAIQMMLTHPETAGADFGRLRAILYAGSPISGETIVRARDTFGCDLIQFYGTSETYMISILRPEQHDPALGRVITSAGAPLPGVEVKAVREDGTDSAPDEIGELWIRSDVMFAGYLNKQEQTDAAMHDGWYRSGDLGYRDSEGNVYIVDRVKDMIVTGGENVYSVEVERALASHPAVAAAAVIGVPDAHWGERVEAFVTLKPGAGATPDELRQHCREHIAGYKVPKAVHIAETLPLTASGKVQKVALRESVLAEASAI